MSSRARSHAAHIFRWLSASDIRAAVMSQPFSAFDSRLMYRFLRRAALSNPLFHPLSSRSYFPYCSTRRAFPAAFPRRGNADRLAFISSASKGRGADIIAFPVMHVFRGRRRPETRIHRPRSAKVTISRFRSTIRGFRPFRDLHARESTLASLLYDGTLIYGSYERNERHGGKTAIERNKEKKGE